MALGTFAAFELGRLKEYYLKGFSGRMYSSETEIAAAAGINADDFMRVMRNSVLQNRLQSQILEAHRLGIQSVPRVCINGKRIDSFDEDLIILIIQEEIKTAPFRNIK